MLRSTRPERSGPERCQDTRQGSPGVTWRHESDPVRGSTLQFPAIGAVTHSPLDIEGLDRVAASARVQSWPGGVLRTVPSHWYMTTHAREWGAEGGRNAVILDD
jgi:hypothetical protein